MINESRLYNFISPCKTFSVKFLEGQKVIQDLAVIHDLRGEQFSIIRDAALSTLPLISFLKPKETLGTYIESSDKNFQFKIEKNSQGHFRTLLNVSSNLNHNSKISGICRLSKMQPNQSSPYTSITEFSNMDLEGIVNNIFRESYQVVSKIILCENSDYTILLSGLPKININQINDEQFANEYEKLEIKFSEYKESISKLEKSFDSLSDELIIKTLEDTGLIYLSSTEVSFKCSCSRERMLAGVKSLLQTVSKEELFKGEKSLETRCDYCHTFYQILESEV